MKQNLPHLCHVLALSPIIRFWYLGTSGLFSELGLQVTPTLKVEIMRVCVSLLITFTHCWTIRQFSIRTACFIKSLPLNRQYHNANKDDQICHYRKDSLGQLLTYVANGVIAFLVATNTKNSTCCKSVFYLL